MPRTLDRLVDFASHFALAYLMKAYRQFGRLFCVHRERLNIVITKFYSPGSSVISMRFNQQDGLIW